MKILNLVFNEMVQQQPLGNVCELQGTLKRGSLNNMPKRTDSLRAKAEEEQPEVSRQVKKGRESPNCHH